MTTRENTDPNGLEPDLARFTTMPNGGREKRIFHYNCVWRSCSEAQSKTGSLKDKNGKDCTDINSDVRKDGEADTEGWIESAFIGDFSEVQ